MQTICVNLKVDCCCESNNKHGTRSSVIKIWIDSRTDSGEHHGSDGCTAQIVDPDDDTVRVLTVDANDKDMHLTNSDRNYTPLKSRMYVHSDSCSYLNVSKMDERDSTEHPGGRVESEALYHTECQTKTLSIIETDDAQLSRPVQETAHQPMPSSVSDVELGVQKVRAYGAAPTTLDAHCHAPSRAPVVQQSHTDELYDLSESHNKDDVYAHVCTQPHVNIASCPSTEVQPRPVSRLAEDGAQQSIEHNDDVSNSDRNSSQRGEVYHHPHRVIPEGHCGYSSAGTPRENESLMFNIPSSTRPGPITEKSVTDEEQQTNPKLASRHPRVGTEDTGEVDTGIISCNLHSVDIYHQNIEDGHASEDVVLDDRDPDEESLSLELRLHSSDILPQTTEPRSGLTTSQMTTSCDDTAARWNEILRLYDLVDAQLYKYPWIVGCMISNEVLEIVSNLSTQAEREAAYDKLCEIVPRDLRQYLLFTEEGPSLLLGSSDGNNESICSG